MTLYRDIIKRTLEIAWRHKILWFFGFFTTAIGSASDIGFLINSIDDLTSQTSSAGTFQTLFIIKAWILALANFFNTPFPANIMMVGMVILFLAVLWLIFTSIAGIIGAVAEIEKGRRQTFENIWKIGARFSWPVLGINLTTKIIAMVLLIGGLPLLKIGVNAASAPETALFLLYFTLIFLPVIFIISLIAKYAMAYVVIKKKPLDQSIAAAVNLFKNNWILSVEMALVIFGLYILAGLGYVILAGFLTAGFKIFSFLGFLLNPSPWWHIITTILALTAYALILLLLGSIMAVIEYAAWAKLFLRLEQGRVQAKIMRLAESLPKYF